MQYVKKFGLFIDNDCNIYSTTKSGRIYALPFGKGGINGKYYKVAYYPVDENWNRLPHDGRQKKAYVHIVIATAFIANPDNKETVDHINRDTHDNRPENLRWATRSEQQQNRGCMDASKAKYGVSRSEDRKEYTRRVYAERRKTLRPVKFGDGSKHMIPVDIAPLYLSLPRSQRVFPVRNSME